MAYASEHPQNVEKLILIGAGGVSADSFRYLEANIRSRLLPSDLEAIAFWSDPKRISANPDRADYELFRAAAPAYVFERKDALKIIEQTTPDTMSRKVRELMIMDLFRSNYDLRPKLKDFKQPVLILQGRQDVIGESTAYQIHQTLPNSELKFIEQSGHFPWIEQTDNFFIAVKDFLTAK